jgi:hypothetical protein
VVSQSAAQRFALPAGRGNGGKTQTIDSTFGAESARARAQPPTCPVHAVLGGVRKGKTFTDGDAVVQYWLKRGGSPTTLDHWLATCGTTLVHVAIATITNVWVKFKNVILEHFCHSAIPCLHNNILVLSANNFH